MPLYEYECDACGRRFELIQRFSDPPQETCALCGGGPVRKLISSAAIQFKGTGWYVTDYAAKDKAKAAGEAGKDKDSKPAPASGEGTKTTSSESSGAGTKEGGGSSTGGSTSGGPSESSTSKSS